VLKSSDHTMMHVKRVHSRQLQPLSSAATQPLEWREMQDLLPHHSNGRDSYLLVLNTLDLSTLAPTCAAFSLPRRAWRRRVVHVPCSRT